jgi:hypothetical protein
LQKRRAQGGGEIEMVQEHSDHLRAVQSQSQSQSQMHSGHDADCGIALMRSLRAFTNVGQRLRLARTLVCSGLGGLPSSWRLARTLLAGPSLLIHFHLHTPRLCLTSPRSTSPRLRHLLEPPLVANSPAVTSASPRILSDLPRVACPCPRPPSRGPSRRGK